jgi:hypothetical protein
MAKSGDLLIGAVDFTGDVAQRSQSHLAPGDVYQTSSQSRL